MSDEKKINFLKIEEETTYVSSEINQPTNQQPQVVVPDMYISVRLTLGHDQLDKVMEVFKDTDFICYKHLGECQENPHFHICVVYPGDMDIRKYKEKIRKRIVDNFKLKGNGGYSIKERDNSILKFIQYASHENTKAYHSGGKWPEYISMAPAWEPKLIQTTMDGPKKRHRDPDVPNQLCYNNYKRAALRHRSKYGLKSTDFTVILSHMCAHDGWDFNIAIRKGGIPLVDYQWFEAMCMGENDYLPLSRTMVYGPDYSNRRVLLNPK